MVLKVLFTQQNLVRNFLSKYFVPCEQTLINENNTIFPEVFQERTCFVSAIREIQ